MGLRTPAGASRGGSFFDRVRDVSAGDGMHTYSCVRYATLPSVCTDYARSVSQADETGFYVVLSIILQTLSSYAMVKCEVCGRGVGYTVSGERIAKLARYC